MTLTARERVEAKRNLESPSLETLYASPKQLEAITGISYATWEAWRRQGKGPRWISVSKRKVLYELASVRAWLEARAVQSTAEADLLPAVGA